MTSKNSLVSIAIALEGILQELRFINSVSQKPPDVKKKAKPKTRTDLAKEFYDKKERGEL